MDKSEQRAASERTVGSSRTIQSEFELLKHRMLLRVLDETANAEAHVMLIREADQSAAMAWATAFPLLVFPCLFEERSAAVAERARWGARLYWTGLEVGVGATVY